MKYEISGNNLQIVTIELEPTEKVDTEAGAMVYTSGKHVLQPKARGGIMKGVKRKLTGESFFLTELSPKGGKGLGGIRRECTRHYQANTLIPRCHALRGKRWSFYLVDLIQNSLFFLPSYVVYRRA